MRHEPTGRLGVYCEHNQAGAILQPATGEGPLWTIFVPINRDEFVESMLRFAERWRLAFGTADDLQH